MQLLFFHKINFSALFFINIFCQQIMFGQAYGMATCVYLSDQSKKSEYELTDAFTLDTEVVLCESSTAISTVKITQFLIVHIIAKPISNPIASSAICNFEKKKLNRFFVSSNNHYF